MSKPQQSEDAPMADTGYSQLPINTQVLGVINYVQESLNISENEAIHLTKLMWAFRSWGSSIAGPQFVAMLELAPMDPREALNVLGTALLSQRAAHGRG